MSDDPTEAGRPRARKAPTAFRTISEVADDLHIPQHVLRFWESKFPQLKPLKRGGGRRYYRPEDIQLLRHIRQCLYQEGYTIRGVQKLLGGEGPADRASEASHAGDPPSLFPLERGRAEGAPAAAPKAGRRAPGRESRPDITAALEDIRR